MTINETHFYKPPLDSNRLSYEEGLKDGIQETINILHQHVNNLMATNNWAKANHYLKAIELIRQGTTK